MTKGENNINAGGPRARKKYGHADIPPPELSREDGQCLARLVERYGVEFIKAAAPKVKKRSRGRPSRGMLPVYEAAHLASWIEEKAEDLRARGEKAPIRKAIIAAFEMMRKDEHFEIELKPKKQELDTIKKRFLRGRKILRDIKETTQRGDFK